MQERTLNIGFVSFPYGGVGASSAEIPEIRHWMCHALIAAKDDPRIAKIYMQDFADTPITMTRNRAVIWAREMEIDVLIMVDSDQIPDVHFETDPEAEKFFPTAFDFVYENWDKGPNVVCAPYCGPPPESCVYVFKWADKNPHSDDETNSLEMYSRDEARVMSGIHPCAAQPTGLIMFDMRAFELTEPRTADDKPWFYYEWTDKYCSQKASTEDVTATRDISMAGMAINGRNPLFCAWDCWAGHRKPLDVGKPQSVSIDQVGKKYVAAVQRGQQKADRLVHIGAGE